MLPAPRILHVHGHSGAGVLNDFFDIGADKAALVFPGVSYTGRMPLLYYTTKVLLDSEYDVLHKRNEYDEQFLSLPEDKQLELFNQDVLALYDALMASKSYKGLMLAGKSLGTTAMRMLLKERKVPPYSRMIWFTPLLDDPDFSSLFQLLPEDSMSLFITGEADDHFDAGVATQIESRDDSTLLVIDGADHSLEIENDHVATIEALKQAIDAVFRFIHA